MMMIKRSFVGIAVLGASVAMQTGAFGMPVGLGEPGTVTDPLVGGTSYTVGAPSWLGNLTAAPTLTASMTGGWTGTATSNVIFLNGSNALGGLGFTYEFAVTSTIPALGELIRVSFGPDWAGVTFSDVGSIAGVAGSTTGASGTPSWTDGDPYSIRRGSTGGVAINFRVDDTLTSDTFGTGIGAGQTSALVWWETDATTFGISSASLIDGGVGGDVAVYAVPEPATLLLGMIGLGGVGWIRKRVK